MHTLCIPCWEGSQVVEDLEPSGRLMLLLLMFAFCPGIPRCSNAFYIDVRLPHEQRDSWMQGIAEEYRVLKTGLFIVWISWFYDVSNDCWVSPLSNVVVVVVVVRQERLWEGVHVVRLYGTISQYPSILKCLRKISKFAWSRFCSFVYMFSYLISSIYQSIELKHMSTVFLFHGKHAKTFSMFPR